MGIGATVLVPAPTLRRTFPAYGSSPVDKTTARTLLACLFADWKGRLLYLSMYSSTYIHISDTYQTHHIGDRHIHTHTSGRVHALQIHTSHRCPSPPPLLPPLLQSPLCPNPTTHSPHSSNIPIQSHLALSATLDISISKTRFFLQGLVNRSIINRLFAIRIMEQHWWFSGKIGRCHLTYPRIWTRCRPAPGSIPGRCILLTVLRGSFFWYFGSTREDVSLRGGNLHFWLVGWMFARSERLPGSGSDHCDEAELAKSASPTCSKPARDFLQATITRDQHLTE